MSINKQWPPFHPQNLKTVHLMRVLLKPSNIFIFSQPLLGTTTHTTWFLFLPHLICLLQAWLISGDHTSQVNIYNIWSRAYMYIQEKQNIPFNAEFLQVLSFAFFMDQPFVLRPYCLGACKMFSASKFLICIIVQF